MSRSMFVVALLLAAVLTTGVYAIGSLDTGPTDPESNTTPEPEEPAVDPANPYDKETLTVGVNAYAAERNVTPEIERALTYWENESESHAGYPIEYDLEPNANNPDVQLTFQDTILRCGQAYSQTTLGCAPIVNESAPDTVDVRIESGWIANTTETTITHELGHTLGLDHNDSPQEVMAAKYEATPIQEDVSIDLVLDTDRHDHDRVREQVNHSLEYWENWSADNLPQNVSYNVSTSESSAIITDDLQIVVSDNPYHCGSDATCASSGTGLTNSPYYKVTLADIETDSIGWVIGYYLGAYHGLEESKFPEPFTSDRPATDEWWTE